MTSFRLRVAFGCAILAGFMMGSSLGFVQVSPSNPAKKPSGLLLAECNELESNKLMQKSIAVVAAAVIIFSDYGALVNAVTFEGDFGTQIVLAKPSAGARGFVRYNRGTTSNPITRTGVRPKVFKSNTSTPTPQVEPKASPQK